jgi:iron complex outermembrane recepter protein
MFLIESTRRFLVSAAVSCCLASALSNARPAMAQSSSSFNSPPCSVGKGAAQELHGTVTDSSQALLPDASVIIECGKFRRTSQSGSDGGYKLSVPPGTYLLRAESPGFTLQPKIVNVKPGAGAMLIDVSLNIVPASNAVTVTANPDYVADNSLTGTKTRTPLIDTPQSVSVVTSMQMEARDVQTVDQAISYTAGVNPEPYGNDPRVDWFFIRGFAENDDAVYLDGLGTSKIYAFESQFMVSPYSLQSVDVVKGPTSVLYGTNEPGGLVNLVSKQPSSEGGHELRFEGGTYNRYQGSLDFSDPLTPNDTWSYRLTGQVRSSGSQVHFAQDDLVYVEPTVEWKPDENTSLIAITNYTMAHQGAIAQFLPAQGTLLPNPNGRISTSFYGADPDFDKYRKKLYFAGYLFQRSLSKRWTVRQNLRFSHMSTLYKTSMALALTKRTCAPCIALR